jgi:glycosyltransferase involved in cell wall biosynthesis
MGMTIPVIYTVHGDVHPSRQRSNLIIRHVARSCDRVVAVSQHTADTMESFTEGAVRPQVVANGINLSRVVPIDKPRRESSRDALGIDKDSLVFVTVARLTNQKDHPTLFRAFAQALPLLGKARLLVVGDGPDRVPLEALRNRLGLEGRIIFLGDVPNINPFLAAADVFVLSTRMEGFGICVIEACYAGLPVITTELGSLKELRKAGLDIVLAKAGDVGSLRDALVSLINPQLRESLGRDLRERAAALFSVDRAAHQYFEIYNEMANNGRSSQIQRV